MKIMTNYANFGLLFLYWWTRVMFAVGNLTLNVKKINSAKIFPQIMIYSPALFSISLIYIAHLIINIKTVSPGSCRDMSCGHRLTGYQELLLLSVVISPDFEIRHLLLKKLEVLHIDKHLPFTQSPFLE